MYESESQMRSHLWASVCHNFGIDRTIGETDQLNDLVRNILNGVAMQRFGTETRLTLEKSGYAIYELSGIPLSILYLLQGRIRIHDYTLAARPEIVEVFQVCSTRSEAAVKPRQPIHPAVILDPPPGTKTKIGNACEYTELIREHVRKENRWLYPASESIVTSTSINGRYVGVSIPSVALQRTNTGWTDICDHVAINFAGGVAAPFLVPVKS